MNDFSIYFYNIFWKTLFYGSLGLNKRFYKILYKRFYLIENNYISYSSNFLVNDLFYFNLFFGYCKLIFSNQFSYKQLFLSKLICIDVCSMYKTYRHIFGLPVNGQRTWSNANTTYYNNLLLRQYKLKKFSIFLNDSKPLSFKKIFLAEYINIFWKKQCFLEWASVRRRRHIFQQSNFYIRYKVDFNYLVNSNIEHFFKKTLELKKKKSHRKKRKFPKNTFNIGWQFGFTKDYLNLLRSVISLKKKKF